MQKRKTLNHNAELMEVLRFTQADLEANRNGSLSEQQLGRLKRQATLYRSLALGILAIGSILAIPMLFISPLLAIILFGGTGLIVLYIFMDMSNDKALYTNPLAEVTGIIKIYERWQRKSVYYAIEINGLRFDIPTYAKQSLHDSDPYTIYYIGKRIFSIEHLKDSPFMTAHGD